MTVIIPHYEKAAAAVGNAAFAIGQRVAELQYWQEQMRCEIESGRWKESRWCESFTPMFVEHARGSRCVVDVGAESGYYSAVARYCMPTDGKVIAVEPDPVHVSLLRRYFAADPHVRIVHAAAGCSAGTLRLTLPPNCSATLVDVPGETFDVQSVVLDALLADVDADLIKIDVEGAEAEVLQGLRGVLSRGRARLYVETHPWIEHVSPDGRERMLHLAAETGYRLFRVDDESARPTDRIGGRLYWQPPLVDEPVKAFQS